MKTIKLRYIIILWLATSLVGAYLKITHRSEIFSEIFLAIALLSSVAIIVKLYLMLTKKVA